MHFSSLFCFLNLEARRLKSIAKVVQADIFSHLLGRMWHLQENDAMSDSGSKRCIDEAVCGGVKPRQKAGGW